MLFKLFQVNPLCMPVLLVLIVKSDLSNVVRVLSLPLPLLQLLPVLPEVLLFCVSPLEHFAVFLLPLVQLPVPFLWKIP